ncbi:MAG: sugar phosphate isomerase/epimerase [Planctomycetes bacterium]|nr:sugar phosphate isomerase/epimerase [Planctomycetota bacterium]
MFFTGFADEAADSLSDQISATRELGWRHIESRRIDGVMIHDLDDAAFDRAAGQLADAGMQVNCFGSAIANWAKHIDKDPDASFDEARRCIPRMRRLGTTHVRIMSYAIRKDAQGRAVADQMEAERFRRVRELNRMFADAGLVAVHENCMNYGGMGWEFTLRLIENVPGLKLVFDTGNPTHSDDHCILARADGWRPKQSSWDFYRRVREHIAYVHIKDGRMEGEGGHMHTWPGEGQGDVACVLKDLLERGYDGGISIEPHIASVFHDPSVVGDAARKRASYIEYGRRTMRLVEALRPGAAVSAAR